MVKTKDELLTAIKSKFGDDTSDETIALLEDISDTLDTNSNGAEMQKKLDDMQKKYEDNDKMWREKYTARFFSNPNPESSPEPSPTPAPDKSEEITINDLFETK